MGRLDVGHKLAPLEGLHPPLEVLRAPLEVQRPPLGVVPRLGVMGLPCWC